MHACMHAFMALSWTGLYALCRHMLQQWLQYCNCIVEQPHCPFMIAFHKHTWSAVARHYALAAPNSLLSPSSNVQFFCCKRCTLKSKTRHVLQLHANSNTSSLLPMVAQMSCTQPVTTHVTLTYLGACQKWSRPSSSSSSLAAFMLS